MPCPFLLFKACAFLQIFFPKKFKGDEKQVLRTSVFLKKRIPLLINQFVSLIELKMYD